MRNTVMIHSESCPEADDTNVNRMWDISVNRKHHLKNLQTIYRQRNQVRLKSEKVHEKRRLQLEQYQRVKEINKNHRNKRFQDKINYENAILRNKLLDVMQDKKKTNSFTNDRRNPYKIKQEEQIYQANLKIGHKLSNIKSQVMDKTKLDEQWRQTGAYMQIAQKRSPKKDSYRKSLVRKKGPSTTLFFPQIDEPFKSIC